MMGKMPPWLRTSSKDKSGPEEEFNKDGETETVQVDEHARH
ncbi:hypothetical protein OESDEN_01680 [Oesophagostomum dentatum]|uniref:Uncharacterized protein n=1 Tax=Oesophagostomum dentatum TaxID=61180 RepID=A0A0B1TR71_OESDE|nr:hypothetical protein OESDEN_01680 [Oesophagostomum dentatum]